MPPVTGASRVQPLHADALVADCFYVLAPGQQLKLPGRGLELLAASVLQAGSIVDSEILNRSFTTLKRMFPGAECSQPEIMTVKVRN